MNFLRSMITSLLVLIILSPACYGEDKSVFMGILIENNDAMIPAFLKSIDDLDYDKKFIQMRLDILNDQPATQALVRQWCDARSDKYSSVSCEVSARKPSEIKNSYLHESKGSTFLFIITSDVFLKPFTIHALTQKNLSVVAPLLRPLPTPNDAFRNFFISATPSGYYQEHADYFPIAERKTIGTFKADCVRGAYLIRTEYNDKLNFEDGSPYDFIAFSNVARKNNISQYICNEREFGFFIHQTERQRNLLLPSILRKVTRTEIKEIASQYSSDESLQRYVDAFPIELYTIFPVQEDLYWVDEKFDWVKSHYIKKGLPWEVHIEAKLKEHAKPGTTVLDIGGHIGTHTISLSKCVGPTGTVHVFEPQAKLFTEMLVNTTLNKCNNVQRHHVALGSEKKTAEIIHPCSTNEGMACIGSGGEHVSMERLDSFNLNNISLIKIDIEGYEIEALKGGLQTIQRNKPVIIIEVFHGPEGDQKLEYIKGLGYDVTHLEDNDYLCLPIKG